MDGKHIQIRCPFKSGSYYHNYKGTFSIIFFAIVDTEYYFWYLNVGPRARDAAVWSECSFKKAIDSKSICFPANHVLVVDNDFPLKPYSKNNLNAKERVFNYRLSRARRKVGNAFGILAARFRIFHKPIELKTCTIDKIIWAKCSLHNWLRIRNPQSVIVLADRKDSLTGKIIDGQWHADIGENKLTSIENLGTSNNYSQDAKQIRNSLANYFMVLVLFLGSGRKLVFQTEYCVKVKKKMKMIFRSFIMKFLLL